MKRDLNYVSVFQMFCVHFVSKNVLFFSKVHYLYILYLFQLYIVNDVMDQAPHFFLCRSLHKSINPCHTITLGAMDEIFVKFLINLLNPNNEETDEEATTVATSDAPRKLPPDFTLLPFKEYSMLHIIHIVCIFRYL